MDDTYTNLPTSHLLGSVPAVVDEDNKATSSEVPEANLQIFPPNSGKNGGNRGHGGAGGYQTIESSSETLEQQSASNWKGFFSISSYTDFFNVDTDIVINRLISSLYPINGDFFTKIDANPDLYGLIWISTTLVFMLSSFGNCATYLINKHTDSTISWSFDVGYFNLAACMIYGYILVVPLGFYFLLHYLGLNAKLVQFWCMWGYSLFVFVLSCFLLVIPVEFLRWVIILLAGSASATFIASNLRSYVEGSDVTMIVVAAFLLQFALAIFIKVWFFT